MSFEEEPTTSGAPAKKVPMMTLEKAVEMGEYDPDNLMVFPEWHQLSKHLQWAYISKGIENRRKFLRVQWARIANAPDYSQKPHLQSTLRGIEKQTNDLQLDEERLSSEYLA